MAQATGPVGGDPQMRTHRANLAPYQHQQLYSLLCPAALTLAHRALAAADRALLPAALIFRLGFSATAAGWAPPSALAVIRFLTPARMLASPFRLSLRFLRAGAAGASVRAGGPRSCCSWFCSASILSWTSAAFRSCRAVKLRIEFMARTLPILTGRSRLIRNCKLKIPDCKL